MNELEERLLLATDRLEEIAGDTGSAFFRDAVRLSLGQPQSEEWLDYSLCRQRMPQTGVYLCLLYAQIWQLNACGLFQAAGEGQTERELVCVTRELILLIYGQVQAGEGAQAIRDSLYWFYLDYVGLTAEYAAGLAEKGAVHGGAMYAWPKECCSPVYERQHCRDYGLFLGGRYASRLVTELLRLKDRDSALVSLICSADPSEAPEGAYALTGHQREVLKNLQDELRHHPGK